MLTLVKTPKRYSTQSTGGEAFGRAKEFFFANSEILTVRNPQISRRLHADCILKALSPWKFSEIMKISPKPLENIWHG